MAAAITLPDGAHRCQQPGYLPVRGAAAVPDLRHPEINPPDKLKAGLKNGPDSDDVVVASSGQTMSLHVRDHSPERIGAIVRFLQRQPWVGVLFTLGKPGGSGVPVEGRVPGTFALELVHLANTERGPDIVFTFPWSSAKSPTGLPGLDYTEASATGPTGRAAPVTPATRVARRAPPAA